MYLHRQVCWASYSAGIFSSKASPKDQFNLTILLNASVTQTLGACITLASYCTLKTWKSAGMGSNPGLAWFKKAVKTQVPLKNVVLRPLKSGCSRYFASYWKHVACVILHPIESTWFASFCVIYHLWMRTITRVFHISAIYCGGYISYFFINSNISFYVCILNLFMCAWKYLF
jgi:hypothetical protein